MRRIIFLLFVLIASLSVQAQDDSQILVVLPWADINEPKIVYGIDVLNGQTEILFSSKVGKSAFRLSPAGDKLAYTAESPNNPYDASLFVYDLEQGIISNTVPHTVVVGRVATEPTAPVWSSDGQTVLVASRDETTHQPNITFVGSNSISSIFPEIPLSGSTVEWSSDDQFLLYRLFDSLSTFATKYVVLDIKDTSGIVITDSSFARWIPGTHDVLTYQETDNENIIQFMRIDTTKFTKEIIKPEFPSSVLNHLWFIDNERLLIVENATQLSFTVLDLPSSTVRRIEMPLDDNHYQKFLLSPDKQYLAAYMINKQALSEIHVYDIQSGILLQSTIVPDENPLIDWIWSHDSKRILLCLNVLNGHYRTYGIMMDGMDTAQLVSDNTGGAILGWAG